MNPRTIFGRSPAIRMASRRSSIARGDGGETLVEFALVVVMVMTLMFGVMAVCMALYSYNVVVEAAREATRYAIVRGSASCADATPDCNASATDIQTYVQGLGFPGIDPSSLTAQTIWSPVNPTDTCSPSSLCNNPGNQVQVTVKYTFPLNVPFIPPQTLAMSTSSQMIISQ